MTVDNVTQVMDKREGDKWEEVMGGLDIPRSLLEEIQKRYSTDAEKIHAGVDYYVNYKPDPSWEDLTIELYVRKEFAAARESKSFMSTGKYCHYITYMYRTHSNYPNVQNYRIVQHYRTCSNYPNILIIRTTYLNILFLSNSSNMLHQYFSYKF